MTRLTTILTLLIGLSIASERLVEIVKGFILPLAQPRIDPAAEGRRKAVLHILAVMSGVLTTFLSRPMIPTEISEAVTPGGVVTLGLLASGVSAFWNSLLTYALGLKDLKRAEVLTLKESRLIAQDAHRDLDLRDEQVTSNACFDVEGV